MDQIEGGRSEVRSPFHPSQTLMRLSPADAWTVGDSFEGTQIFGATGSGKTSGSGRAIAKAFLQSGYGGLVLTAKPDETETWRRYARETGREDSLLIVSPDSGHRFNFLHYESRRPGAGSGLTDNLVALFTTVLESGEDGGLGTGDDSYWNKALRQLLRNAIDAIRLAGLDLSLPLIADVIASAPQDYEQRSDPNWQSGSVCFACLEAAEKHAGNNQSRATFTATLRFWMEEYPGLAERTRSSIVSTFTSMADGFLRGTLHELFCTETTFVPELSQEGVVIVLDLPVKAYHDLGRHAQVLFKYVWQRAIERRDVNANPRPVFLWMDEAQHFVTSRDMEFQATARSSRAATVMLTQNISNYLAAIGGNNAQASVDSLLGNLQTKIFHANGDAVTNNWAEQMFAEQWRRHTSTGHSDQQDGRGRSMSSNSSESLDPEVLAHLFTRLGKGGPQNGYLVESIVAQGGRVWNATGRTHLRVAFDQRA